MKWLSSLLFMLVLLGCFLEGKSDSNSGDLFFGLSLGQSREDFYEQCWKLNKEEKVTHSENMYVHYEMLHDSITKISMLFYPDFDRENNMKMMDVQFKFNAWAPWNEYQSSKLLPIVLDTLMQWYPGTPFEQNADKKIYTKNEGRRYIVVSIKNDERVRVQIFDKNNKEFKQK